MNTPIQPHATDVAVLFRDRPGTEQVRDGITFAEYDITWPDGRPVQAGLNRLCNYGSRLVLGRSYQGGEALVRLTIHPVAGLKAPLTRPAGGVRCRRLYALRHGDIIRLHFLNGTPTEIVFHAGQDEPHVLRWLQADLMRSGEPFWFDLGSQTFSEKGTASEYLSCVAPGPALAPAGNPRPVP